MMFSLSSVKLSTKEHYQKARVALKTLKPQWRNIGLALGFPVYKLNEYTGTDSDKMDKMLEDWLNETFKDPTWRALVEALGDPDQVAGGKPVANEIEAKYGGGASASATSSTAPSTTTPSGVQLGEKCTYTQVYTATSHIGCY